MASWMRVEIGIPLTMGPNLIGVQKYDSSRLPYRYFLKNLTVASNEPSLPAFTFGLLWISDVRVHRRDPQIVIRYPPGRRELQIHECNHPSMSSGNQEQISPLQESHQLSLVPPSVIGGQFHSY